MEEIAKCKELKAIYADDKAMLAGPKTIKFDIEDNRIHISIFQMSFREIVISSDEDVAVNELHGAFSKVERLLMLFEGSFLQLQELEFSKSDISSEATLKAHQDNSIRQRLSYFNSDRFVNYKRDTLLDFDKVLTSEIYSKWKILLEELDIVHQMYLYALSNNKIPVDVKCSFMIELAEPLVEIVNENTGFFASLTPGGRNTSLKMCIDALITKYGTEIFKRELSGGYDFFLESLVASRVRIMHIKRKQKKLFFDGNESRLYMYKLSLLYRRIMFELLGVNEEDYKERLSNCVCKADQWNDVLEHFLLKKK